MSSTYSVSKPPAVNRSANRRPASRLAGSKAPKWLGRLKKADATTESVDAKLKVATELVQKHAEALYKAAGEKDKKEEPKAEEGKAEEAKTDTKTAEEGEVVE